MRLEIFDFAKPNLRLWWSAKLTEGGPDEFSNYPLPPFRFATLSTSPSRGRIGRRAIRGEA